jgi:hypothetical protein
MANKFQIKRTSVTGRTPNTTSSGNTHFIDTGELALNLTDGKLFSSNGSVSFEVGANLQNLTVSSNANLKTIIANGSVGSAGQALVSNGTGIYWTTISATSSGTVTNVGTGDGLTGGPVTTTGTISVLANTGIVANASGLYVNSAYITTLDANNASYLNGNTAANLRSYSDTTAATAYSNAVSTAASDATSKAETAYSNAVSTAASDASSKAATAYSNATSYADTKAATAYSNATSYADTKAATAYSNAVSTAATDASSKAVTAYSNATSYADTKAATAYSNAVSVAATDASSKAATAYSNATSYADTKAATAYSNATSYADTKASAAYSNAVSYVDGKSFVNTTQLSSNLSNYALLSGASFTGNVSVGGIYLNPTSNTIQLGNTTARWALSANTGDFTGAITGISANLSTSVNSALLTVGTSFIANATQLTIATPVAANGSVGTGGQVLKSNGATGSPYWSTLSASGDVVGPASSTNNAIVRFDGTTGKLVKNSNITIDDSGNIAAADTLLNRVVLQDTAWGWSDSSTNNTISYINGSVQRWAPTTSSNPTLTITNWPPSGTMGELLIEGVNLAGAGTISLAAGPTYNILKSDGTYATAFTTSGVVFTSGTDWILLWTRDSGSTIFMKVMR